jgi:Fe-S-cluster-containing dehydrogenase component/formate-dependent nitrite reductase membrane component NrfD
MQLGFVIDHSRCIGCHACTVACKAENGVPLGSFRTWVKYTEAGTFPEVRRSFAVLRCNQCTDAPCVTICPVRALDKRPDGIVDVDPAACIGCKACMQGCPYDALYLNEAKGIAEKCHFCAHRVERGQAPACAVVCPTEAIVPGDFHDKNSVVSRLRSEHDLSARKTEAGTRPNVLYRQAGEAGIDPRQTHATGDYLWATRLPGVPLDAEQFLARQQEAEARARTSYDVDHPVRWGWKVSAYLFTKSLAAGLFLAPALALWSRGVAWESRSALALPLGAMLFLLLTTVLLIADLKRPERFLYILLRPNWDSWLTRGSLVLMGYGGVLTLWLGAIVTGFTPPPVIAALLLAAGGVLAALTACYTGWLFGQARGRVLWMRRGLWLHLIVQAIAVGAAAALCVRYAIDLAPPAVTALRWCLGVAVALHGLFVLTEDRFAPRDREEEFATAVRLVRRGPFARRHLASIVLGVVVPLVLLPIPGVGALWVIAALATLVGLYMDEETLVRAGQALPIS